MDEHLRWFDYEHLPPNLKGVSKAFADLAHQMAYELRSGPQTTLMLQKLLEAKDCAVRAKVAGAGGIPQNGR